MKLIVGLGNPGDDYINTRHNIGFDIIDRWGARLRRPVKVRECDSLTARVSLNNIPVLLAKPQTYMNLSGNAVVALCSKYDISPITDLIVIVDDVALPFSKLRIRSKGSSGGHNGLKSIIARLGTDNFSRLRFGILPERQVTDLADFVLGKFSQAERKILPEIIDRAIDAIGMWNSDGIEQTMASFN